MPCMDFWPEERNAQAEKEAQERRDMLARTACAALTVLEDMILEKLPKNHHLYKGLGPQQTLRLALKSVGGLSQEHLEQSMNWWSAHKRADAAAKKKRTAELKKKQQEAAELGSVLSKLSPEELELLTAKGVLSTKGARLAKPAKAPRDYNGTAIAVGDTVENAKSGNSGTVKEITDEGILVVYDALTAGETRRKTGLFRPDETIVRSSLRPNPSNKEDAFRPDPDIVHGPAGLKVRKASKSKKSR